MSLRFTVCSTTPTRPLSLRWASYSSASKSSGETELKSGGRPSGLWLGHADARQVYDLPKDYLLNGGL